MTAIASTTSSTSMLQQLLAQQQSQMLGSVNLTGPPKGTAPPEDGGQHLIDAVVEASGLAADSEEATALTEDLQSAIDEALANAGDTDPREAVRSAVDSVLEDHGIDAAAVQEQMGPPPGPPPDQASSTTSTGLSADALTSLSAYTGASSDLWSQLALMDLSV